VALAGFVGTLLDLSFVVSLSNQIPSEEPFDGLRANGEMLVAGTYLNRPGNYF